MGDISLVDRCDKFVKAFESAILTKHSTLEGIATKHYLGVDDATFEVFLLADIDTPFGEQTVRLESVPTPMFNASMNDDDALIEQIMIILDVEEDEAREKLVKAGLIDV
jgi:hypothetical protein